MKDLCVERRAEPCSIVVFGAGGDLARRMLLPALACLRRRRLLGRGTRLIGVGRRRSGGRGLDHWVRGDVARGEVYADLCRLLRRLDSKQGTGGNVLFYLALPPSVFKAVPPGLKAAGLLEGCRPGGWTRVVVEKPFGMDLAGAKRLDRRLRAVLREDQIYRIDHFLGKDTVQNLLVLRFQNAVFEPVWDRRFIDHVQVSVLEDLGMEGRGAYYDEAGVVRDMFQNHMAQLLSLVLMDEPRTPEAEALRDERVKALRKLKVTDIVGGQYEGYPREPGVRPGSRTLTYCAMRLESSSSRWRGVPFYLRSGKRLARKEAEVRVVFKGGTNTVLFRVQPEEGVLLGVTVKQPGPRFCTARRALELSYSRSFQGYRPTPYEHLILDCLAGDQALFLRQDSVEAAWRLFARQLAGPAAPVRRYAPGSWGPREADRLLEREGRAWGKP